MRHYEYQVTETPDLPITTRSIQTIADDLMEDGWEFIGFTHSKTISRRIVT